jgi:hypothetical protein
MRTVIVDRNYPEIFRALALALQQAASVRLTWDRRKQADRRSRVDARRRADRRGRPSDAWVQNHWIVLENDRPQRN